MMHEAAPFSNPTPGTFPAAHLARVVSVKDPKKLSRVQVRLLAVDGVGDQDGPVWARVAVPVAGGKRGSFLIPDVGDEVLVVFVNGDPRLPVVVGGLWNKADAPPETLNGDRVDRWTLVGKAGTRIAIVEEGNGSATIAFETPGKVRGTLTDAEGGKVEFSSHGSTITIDAKGVTVTTTKKVSVDATSIEAKAGTVTVHAALAKFDGIVKCETLIATNVRSKTYTPGIGNVW